MSEERSAKLKLKRKKCTSTAQGGQEVEVRPQASSALNLRQDFTGSWFDEIELTAAEQIWKQVLSSVYLDLSNVGWGAVPSLPDVSLKMSRKEEEMIDTEVFKVGDMNFEWFPLPTALTIDNAEEPCAAEVEDNQQNIEHIKTPLSEALPENVQQTKSTVLPIKQVRIPVCSEESKRNTENLPTPHNGSTKNISLPQTSQKSVSENVTKPRTLLKGSSRNVKEPQILQKGSSRNAKELQPSQKGSTKHTKEQQTSQKPKINLWATVTSLKSTKTIQVHNGKGEPETEEKPQPSHVITADASEGSSRGRKIKESAGVSAGATSSLDKCPICLLQFPKQFSQLDMDSHLAQCLSETTVDVAW
ncbi:uncharacterized protein LOC122926764 isoform X1 [Bufo gargarizans]|uniref:uncharacterized protein LOC122926764 isoform X1 n=2 Tax=Bufo gargarizans TaxID=30331 RepID=UPI001CF13488|nr:uncharacterized protein LOC122926764 isoform X1 [Bufo gargarizans]